ncbi:hypothetical protein MNBD_DELTA01-2121 [hydrothermal vent metagenome]|uniref:Uncharacterized protein n=1 Tax=hydrothermal vent metagenome TaxID=652676 RepID=A0A3B0QQ40_9ZZZZ
MVLNVDIMNMEKLKDAKDDFMKKYPGGFKHPVIVEIGKKHKMDKMVQLTQESFEKERFGDTDDILNSMVKVISKSSMVSVFEKPRFRDSIKQMPADRTLPSVVF